MCNKLRLISAEISIPKYDNGQNKIDIKKKVSF